MALEISSSRAEVKTTNGDLRTVWSYPTYLHELYTEEEKSRYRTSFPVHYHTRDIGKPSTFTFDPELIRLDAMLHNVYTYLEVPTIAKKIERKDDYFSGVKSWTRISIVHGLPFSSIIYVPTEDYNTAEKDRIVRQRAKVENDLYEITNYKTNKNRTVLVLPRKIGYNGSKHAIYELNSSRAFNFNVLDFMFLDSRMVLPTPLRTNEDLLSIQHHEELHGIIRTHFPNLRRLYQRVPSIEEGLALSIMQIATNRRAGLPCEYNDFLELHRQDKLRSKQERFYSQKETILGFAFIETILNEVSFAEALKMLEVTVQNVPLNKFTNYNSLSAVKGYYKSLLTHMFGKEKSTQLMQDLDTYLRDLEEHYLALNNAQKRLENF